MKLENLLAWFRRSFGQIGVSGEAARNRLQLVLVHDRSGLSSENLDLMKNDLVEVISKYLTIDQESLEVEVQRSGDSVVLSTNIQIAGIDRKSTQFKPPTSEPFEEGTISSPQEGEDNDITVSLNTSDNVRHSKKALERNKQARGKI
jgi:cell division topological specificity factor